MKERGKTKWAKYLNYGNIFKTTITLINIFWSELGLILLCIELINPPKLWVISKFDRHFLHISLIYIRGKKCQQGQLQGQKTLVAFHSRPISRVTTDHYIHTLLLLQLGGKFTHRKHPLTYLWDVLVNFAILMKLRYIIWHLDIPG